MLGHFKLGLKKSINDHRDLKLQIEPNYLLNMKFQLYDVYTINNITIVRQMLYVIKLCH